MGTDRGRLRAGLGHVHPPGRRRHRPRPRHLARHSRRRGRLHRPRQRRVPPPAGRPHQPHPPRAHGSPRPPHGPRLHQLQHPNSDRRPKGRRGVLVSRDSTNGPMTAPMPIAPSSSPKAARPDPQLPASTTSNALVAPARQGGEQLDQREQPQQPETASSRIPSPTRPRHGPALGRHKPSTANNHHRGLHAVYRWPEDEEDIPQPMRKLKMRWQRRSGWRSPTPSATWRLHSPAGSSSGSSGGCGRASASAPPPRWPRTRARCPRSALGGARYSR